MYMCELSGSKESMCKTKRKREHCNTHTSREKSITYCFVIDQHFFFISSTKREKKTKRRIISQMTIHLSFIDNRDVITTTTTLDTSNNIYQMVRIKHLFFLFKKDKIFFFLDNFSI